MCLFLPSCASKSSHERPVDYVTVIANLPDCKRPDKIKIAEIDSEQHIGSVDNTIDLDEVIVSLYLYNQQLESTLDCFEKRRTMLESNTVKDSISQTSKEEKKE